MSDLTHQRPPDWIDGPVGWGIVELADEIGARLGLRVDLVTRSALRRRIGQRIREEAQAL